MFRLWCFAACACISFRLGLCFFFLYRGCFFGKLRRGYFCFGLYGSFLWGLCLFGGLFLILCLLDFCKMSVYGINQTCGGAADCFKRAFQFCKFFSADFMDCGLDVLQFVHTLVDRDTLFLIIAASFYAAA